MSVAYWHPTRLRSVGHCPWEVLVKPAVDDVVGVGLGMVLSAAIRLARQKPRWVPDSEAAACMCCAKQFGMLTRPHHCRYCGWVVCSGCSGGTVVLQRCAPD